MWRRPVRGSRTRVRCRAFPKGRRIWEGRNLRIGTRDKTRVGAETVLMTYTCIRDPYKRNTGHNIDADIPEHSPSKLERAALTR